MKKELEDKERFIENLQRELDGVSFTPNRCEYIYINYFILKIFWHELNIY